MPKRTMLFICGGLRIGDTFHLIPFLREASKTYHIHWVHGSYAREASEFIRDFIQDMDITTECRPDKKLPTGLSDTVNFYKTYVPEFDIHKYNIVVPENELDRASYSKLVCAGFLNFEFDVCGIKFHRLKDSIVTLKNDPPQGDHIVIQPRTISAWKVSDSLVTMGSRIMGDRTIYNVGNEHERVIKGPNVTTLNGKPLSEVAYLIRASYFTIALHSSMACLAYYLGAPLLCVSFGEGFYPFDKERRNNTVLVKSSLDLLQTTTRSYLDSPRKRLNSEDIKCPFLISR